MSLPSQEIETKYEILHKLAEGGMGAVYKVRHRLLDEVRVIKVIRPQHKESQSLQARFRSEARAAIQLRHPNVAQVYDFTTTSDGSAYLVMEYIEGMTLQDLLARCGPPPLGLTIEIARQSLAALGYLHQRGYVHRDIAPDNLMLTGHHQGGPMVKVIDLGLAKRQAGALQLTATGLFVGKVRYSSPEQFGRASRETDPRSDLYSFGVVLYELLTGVCPIRGSSFEEIIASHVLQPPLPFAETDPQGKVPEALRRLVLSALEKDPAQRIPTATQLDSLLAPFQPQEVPTFNAIRQRFEQAAEGPQQDPTVSATADTVLPANTNVRTEDVRTEAYPPQELTIPFTEAVAPTEQENFEEGQDSSAPPMGSSKRILFPTAALLLLLLAALGLERWRTPDAAQEDDVLMNVLVEAIPWAEITAITNSKGQDLDFDAGLYTPAVLSLPPGEYGITLNHPNTAEDQTVHVEVTSNGTTSSGPVRFDPLTADAYFESVGLHSFLEKAGS